MPTVVRAYPRLHFCLLDLGFATPRSYGGAGCLIDDLPFTIRAERDHDGRVNFLREVEERTASDCEALLARLYDIPGSEKCSVLVTGGPPEHVGLGSKTSLLLGIAAAASHASGLHLSRTDIVRLTGRGGASGVGVNAFFTGGFIADDGHDVAKVSILTSSSARTPGEIPMATVSCPMPTDWRVCGALGPGTRPSGASEHIFFANAAPVPREEALESIALIYHGLVPAIRRRSYHLFRDCLAKIQETAFKSREIERQGPPIRKALATLTTAGLAAGMSSMGPLIFVVYQEAAPSADIHNLLCNMGFNVITDTRFRNSRTEVVSD